MARSIQLTVSPRQLSDLRKILDPSQFKRAVFQAVSRTTKKGESIAAKAVLDRMSIPRKYVVGKNRYAAIKHSVSRGDVPEGKIKVRDVSLPLSAFDYKDSGVVGVTIKIDKLKSPIVLRHAFVEKMRSAAQEAQGSGHIGVMSRKSIFNQGRIGQGYTYRDKRYKIGKTPDGYAWRLPLREHFGPSVLKFITFPEIEAEVVRGLGNELEKQIDSQVSRFTGGKFATLRDAVSDLGLSFTDNEPTNNG